jgi:hypothetical protein
MKKSNEVKTVATSTSTENAKIIFKAGKHLLKSEGMAQEVFEIYEEQKEKGIQKLNPFLHSVYFEEGKLLFNKKGNKYLPYSVLIREMKEGLKVSKVKLQNYKELNALCTACGKLQKGESDNEKSEIEKKLQECFNKFKKDANKDSTSCLKDAMADYEAWQESK